MKKILLTLSFFISLSAAEPLREIDLNLAVSCYAMLKEMNSGSRSFKPNTRHITSSSSSKTITIQSKLDETFRLDASACMSLNHDLKQIEKIKESLDLNYKYPEILEKVTRILSYPFYERVESFVKKNNNNFYELQRLIAKLKTNHNFTATQISKMIEDLCEILETMLAIETPNSKNFDSYDELQFEFTD